MSRLLPKSLFGQTLLILLAGLIISHAVGSWIYTADREQAVRAVGGFAAAQRIANLTRLVQEAPQEWRERIVAALSDQSFPRFAFGRASGDRAGKRRRAGGPGDQGVPRRSAIARIGAAAARVRVAPGRPAVRRLASDDGARPDDAWLRPGFGGFRDLQVAIPLPDGQWLSFATALPESGPSFSRQFLLSMALMAIIILAVSVWAVRRVTAPLASLSAAAERLGNDLNAPPMPETGTIETRQASHAFNTMQARLRGLIENRTRMLAAISHDLRTPLTLLRLRAENVENAPEREKMLATIAEMDADGRRHAAVCPRRSAAEPRRRPILRRFFQSIVDDMADAGLAGRDGACRAVVCECQPAALKRAIRNLIDNAVKYGKRASAAIRSTPQAIEITIDDEGPGIPEDELARVFQPFYRVEVIAKSRDRRDRPWVGDRAFGRASTRRPAHALEPAGGWPSRLRQAAVPIPISCNCPDIERSIGRNGCSVSASRSLTQ